MQPWTEEPWLEGKKDELAERRKVEQQVGAVETKTEESNVKAHSQPTMVAKSGEADDLPRHRNCRSAARCQQLHTLAHLCDA
eukprot:3074575-Pleurochrysis_carterae.AAC.1